MFKKMLVAGATVVALSGLALSTVGPALAAGPWTVLQEASSGQCYVANRPAGPFEAQVGGSFGSEQQAQTAMRSIAACDTYGLLDQ